MSHPMQDLRGAIAKSLAAQAAVIKAARDASAQAHAEAQAERDRLAAQQAGTPEQEGTA